MLKKEKILIITMNSNIQNLKVPDIVEQNTRRPRYCMQYTIKGICSKSDGDNLPRSELDEIRTGVLEDQKCDAE